MKKIPLREYLADVGTQKVLADALGIQQSAVSQMARSDRNIEITIYANGRIEANEIRAIPAKPKRAVA
jgi:DNA-binding transcriptional regulator YdaS (Cro superfamily)